ncbi:hypothetical protein NECAME_09697 [Necator americanus]|uniref:Uncharacterized protein n=1 Tax=Necator americanus TaxID=51031 RepID=W2TEM3_NECAM|nr:hypothetical protein NECAME_09697 [Necator americanus]ETN79651.1 hypothetical protein NECAME_09697 [Necator americanus]
MTEEKRPTTHAQECVERGNMTSVSPNVLQTPESTIEYAITNPRILNVSEMLAEQNMQALQQSNPTLFKTLEVFSYGTLKDLPEGVDDWASRDIPVTSIASIVTTLTEFAQSANDVLQQTLVDADRRDAQVMADRKRAQQAEADLLAARKALDESMLATMNSHDQSTSTRAKATRSARQRPGPTTPASK